MPQEVVDQPVVDAPAPEDFDTYVARREEELARSAEPAQEDEDAIDIPSEEPGPAASEPATSETPAAVEKQPEPAAASEPAKDNQEPEVKGAIPQSRLDEVTKARREAERKLEAAE